MGMFHHRNVVKMKSTSSVARLVNPHARTQIPVAPSNVCKVASVQTLVVARNVTELLMALAKRSGGASKMWIITASADLWCSGPYYQSSCACVEPFEDALNW